MDQKARVLPEPERYAVCAPEGVSIKAYYHGYFDEVFLFFHPFLRPKSAVVPAMTPEVCPDKFMLIRHYEPVSWTEFLKISSIGGFDELDIGLRTRIHGLKSICATMRLPI